MRYAGICYSMGFAERLEISRSKHVCIYDVHNDPPLSYLRRIFTNTTNVHAYNLKNPEINFHIPRPQQSLETGGYSIEDLLCGTESPKSEDMTHPILRGFKKLLKEKDYYFSSENFNS